MSNTISSLWNLFTQVKHLKFPEKRVMQVVTVAVITQCKCGVRKGMSGKQKEVNQ